MRTLNLLTFAVPFQKASIILPMCWISIQPFETKPLSTYSFTSLHSGAREADIFADCCWSFGPKTKIDLPEVPVSTGKLVKTAKPLLCACHLADDDGHQLRRPLLVSRRCGLTSLTLGFYVHTEFPDNRRDDAVLGKWNKTQSTGL